MDYQCSNCKTTYSSAEYEQLETQPYGGSEDARGNGNERVCGACGCGMHSDKWQLFAEVVTDEHGTVTVSTVHLIIPHGRDRDLWYETLVGRYVEQRYRTEEAAKAGHETYVNKLRRGEFHVETTTNERLVFDNQ